MLIQNRTEQNRTEQNRRFMSIHGYVYQISNIFICTVQ